MIKLSLANIEVYPALKDKTFQLEGMQVFRPQSLVNEIMLERTSNIFETPYLMLGEVSKSAS